MITIKDLNFSYSERPFIDRMNFEVKAGEIFGFLGPSGAGKSTIQKILIGLLPQYSGSVRVNGIEVKDRQNDFYESIGVDFEYPSLYEKLTGRQNLVYFASLYDQEGYSPEVLLKSVGLEHEADKKVADYSKGMKSRLNFIKALIHQPQILFLDEPTSGLDPSNARVMKDMILEQKALGTTIILTTHNMEDAAELCDRVAFIVDGAIKVVDTPHKLIMNKGASRIKYSYLEAGKEVMGETLLDEVDQDHKLEDIIKNKDLLTIHSSEPSLGDIFIEITGRSLS